MHTYKLERYHWPRRILLVIVGCFLLLTLAARTTRTYADGIPGGNVTDPSVRAVDIARPAVVRIITTIGGHLTVHFSGSQVVTFPQSSNKGYPLELSGSGTFISAHGDILTADHVVNPPHDTQLDQFLEQTAAPDVATYYDSNVDPKAPQSQAQIAQDLENGEFNPSTQYDTPGSDVYLSTDYTGPLSAQSISNVPTSIHATVDRIEQQSSFNDKDVAIVHVNNMNDMPSISLADSSTVQEQDVLTIIGFPGNGDVSDTNPTDFFTSSVNKVFVSSMKTTDTGAPVIQVSGNVEHGDSGGPALNSQGSVVGIVSFGTAGSGPGNTSFLQASNSARGLVQSLHLDTTPGPFEKAWALAFTDYASTAQGHWHKAAQEFQAIASHYSLFQAITSYLDYAQAQAKNERLPQSTPAKSTSASSSFFSSLTVYGWIIAAAAVLIVLLLLFALVWFWWRRRQKASRVPKVGQPSSMAPLMAQGSNMPNTSAANFQGTYGSPMASGMTAFGAPPVPSQSMPGTVQSFPGQPLPTQSQSSTNGTAASLRPWPCGHMNRPQARYCSVCGEPAPPQPMIHRYEQ